MSKEVICDREMTDLGFTQESLEAAHREAAETPGAVFYGDVLGGEPDSGESRLVAGSEESA